MSGWQALTAAAREPEIRLTAALADPAEQQAQWLEAMIARNQASDFGQRHGFAGIGNVEDYRACVPVRGYEGFADEILRIADGEPNVLTTEPVIAFEETGGTTAGAKLVPYTASGLAAFGKGVLPWLADLARARPAVVNGPAYWAISPAGRRPRRTTGGLPVGFANDAGYLGEDLVPAFLGLSAVAPALGQIRDMELWRFLTLRCLIERDDLALVSIWNPSFFSMLVDGLAVHGDALARALHDGTPGADVPPGWGRAFTPRPDRARVVETALSRDPPELAALWPALDTVSCWADGAAEPAARRLATLLPHTRIQAKGLLATEGMVTIPLTGYDYPVAALTSGFLEFIDQPGVARLAHQLKEGESYRTVITTENGFYRYDLGDQVLCRGVKAGAPMLQFLGRADNRSDLVGEKLDEGFVASCLAGVGRFAALVALDGVEPRYILVLDGREEATALERMIDDRLCANPQYAYARRLGQLQPVRIEVKPGAERAYLDWRVKQGQRLGDVKPPALIKDARIAHAAWPGLGLTEPESQTVSPRSPSENDLAVL